MTFLEIRLRFTLWQGQLSYDESSIFIGPRPTKECLSYMSEEEQRKHKVQQFQKKTQCSKDHDIQRDSRGDGPSIMKMKNSFSGEAVISHKMGCKKPVPSEFECSMPKKVIEKRER